MIDQIDKLAARREIELEQGLAAVIDQANAAFDLLTTAAILANADDDGASDHERDELATIMGTDSDLEWLADAFDQSAAIIALDSFFIAIAALAAASAKHVLNSNDTKLIAARNEAASTFRNGFLQESTKAFREAAERMLHAIGTAETRAAHIRRTIGLSSAQGRSLIVLRQALHTYLAAPRKLIPAATINGKRVPANYQRQVDVDILISATRGNLSAAQQRMLTKAFRNDIDAPGVERLLDRHATALRGARIKTVAGDTVHRLTETAKLTGWQIAQRFGALPTDQRRYWRTAGDERVRRAHDQVPALNASGVQLGQLFETPFGKVFAPPLEYGCRCKATLGNVQ